MNPAVSHPSPDALLEHVGFLRSIALGLLRNEADAEDVVQQTLVAALEKPPQDGSNLKGWLGTVARNFALMQFRRRKRQREREARVAKPDGAPSGERITERLEMERRVVDAVASLEEPFRTMVILRYYDGLQPKEIAERLGIPAATVRTRLKRGLDRMRGDLEERSGGRRSMLAGLLLLAQLPAQAASPWPVRLVAAAGVAALVVTVVTVAWLLDVSRPEPPARRTVQAEVKFVDPTLAVLLAEPQPLRDGLSGRVVNDERMPIPHAEVLIYPHEGPGRLETPVRRLRRYLETPEPLARTRTDARGRYALTLPRNRPVWIVARKDGYTIDAFPVLDTSGRYDEADLRLERTRGLELRVLGSNRQPIGDATVRAWDPRLSDEFFPGIIAGTTHADGTVTLPIEPRPRIAGRSSWVAVTLVVDARHLGYAPRLVPFQPAWNRTVQIDRGAGARVDFRDGPADLVVLLGQRDTGPPRIDLRAGGDSLSWDDLGAENDILALRAGRAPQLELLPLPPSRNSTRAATWTWDEGDHVVEDVVDPPGAEVGLVPHRKLRARMMFGVDCLDFATSDERGRFRLHGEGGIVVAHPELAPILSDRPGPPRPAVRWTGRLVDALGNPVAGARVMANPIERSPLLDHYYKRQFGNWIAITRRDGTFTIGHLPPGNRDLFRLCAAHPGRGLRSESGPDEIAIRMHAVIHWESTDARVPRPEPATLLADPDEIAARQVRGVVRNRAGEPVAGVQVMIEGRPDEVVWTGEDGDFEIPVVGTDRSGCVLVMRRPGLGSGRFLRVLPSERHHTFTLPAWEPFHGRVMHGSDPVAGAYVRSFVEDRLVEEAHTDARGEFSLARTPFTREFDLSISHPEFLTAWHENPVEGDLPLERASAVRLRVLDQEGRPAPYVELVVDGARRRTDMRGNVDVFRNAHDGLDVAIAPVGSDWIVAGALEWSADRALATMRIRPGVRIEGVVRDARNRPVPHVLVLAEPVEEGRPVRRAFTNARGRFVLRALHPERYRLRLSEAADAVEVEAGRDDVVLQKENE